MNRVARLGAALDRFLLPLVLGAAVLGLTVPAPAREAVNQHGVTIALVVLVFAVGLGLPVSGLAQTRAYAGRLGVVVLVPLVALPALAWGASRLVDPGPLRDGVLTAGVAPTEVAAVALTALAGGSAALSGAVLIGSTIGSVLLAGATLHLLATPTGSASTASLLASLLRIVALPLAVGVASRAALPSRRQPAAENVSTAGASVAVLVLIWLVAGQAHLGGAYLQAAFALLLLVAGSAATGALLTRGLPGPIRTSLLLPVAMRDFAIAAGIATQAFGSAAAAPLGVYGVLVLLLGTAAARAPSNARSRGADQR